MLPHVPYLADARSFPTSRTFLRDSVLEWPALRRFSAPRPAAKQSARGLAHSKTLPRLSRATI